jgi:hypothetical protein
MLKRKAVRASRFVASIPLLFVAAMVASPSITRADPPSYQNTQSQANRLSLFHGYGLSAFGTSSNANIPGEPGGGLMHSFMGQWASTDNTVSDRDWSVSATPMIGYDTNPEARHVDQNSFFGGVDAVAAYSLDLEPDNSDLGGPTNLFASYEVGAALYEGPASAANVIQQTLTGGVKHGFFHDWLNLSAEVRDQFTFMQGHSFANTVDVVPSAEVFWLPQVSTEFTYDYTNFDYFYRVIATQDQDANRHTVTAILHLYTVSQVSDVPVGEPRDRLSEILRKTLRQAVIGAAYIENNSDGSSYAYNGERFFVGFQYLHFPTMPDLGLDLQYAHEWQHYENFTTELPPALGGTGIGFKRNDDIDLLTLRLDARLMDLARHRGTLAAYLQYDLIVDSSNVFLRDFDEDIISAGITYRY